MVALFPPNSTSKNFNPLPNRREKFAGDDSAAKLGNLPNLFDVYSQILANFAILLAQMGILRLN
jgi:hypothetical protein